MSSRPDGTDTPTHAAPGPDIPPHAAPFLSGAWPLAVLLLLAILPYAGTLGNDFAYIYDDKAQIIDNPYVHSFGHLRETLTTTVWSFTDAHGMTNYYRPIMTIGFLLCYQVFGPLALGFHLTSLLLHAAVVTVLFLFARRLFRDRGVDFRRHRPGGDLLLYAHLLVFLACGRAARRTAAVGAGGHDTEFSSGPP